MVQVAQDTKRMLGAGSSRHQKNVKVLAYFRPLFSMSPKNRKPSVFSRGIEVEHWCEIKTTGCSWLTLAQY